MIRWIESLKDKHKDDDIYVIGSGKSLDFFNTDFFDDKIIIGVNQVYKKLDCDYIVRKENTYLKESLKSGADVIISEYNYGNYSNGLAELIDVDNLYYFKHLNNQHNKIDTSVFGTDKIVVSFSTITSAIHIAAYMGAKNIVLIGHDCGTINGELTFKGYYNSINDTPWKDWNQYKNWLKVIEQQTIITKNEVKKHYNANVVSLIPFVSLNLENNIYL